MVVQNEFSRKLKILMVLRALSSLVLLSVTLFLGPDNTTALPGTPAAVLSTFSLGFFLVSLVYFIFLKYLRNLHAFAYFQVSVDTIFVTTIIFLTGGLYSVYVFLYLFLIIYSSILFSRRGCMFIAALCSIQFGLLINIEGYGFIGPYFIGERLSYSDYWQHAMMIILITMGACFASAFLSSYLSEQLKKTKKELQAAEDHLRRVEKMTSIVGMAAGLAHEIKNPLASLTGSIQMLAEDVKEGHDHIKLMKIVMREADRLSSLTNRFLMFTNIPPGKPKPMLLDVALMETVALLKTDSSFDGRVSFRTDLVPNVWVNVDPGHFRQIGWNLLLNAAESIEGGGEVYCAMHCLKDQVTVKIGDSGCGITDEEIKMIFNPFFTTKATGTGLGLSIVHSILEAYDARLDVESRPGEGTVFSLHLKTIDPPI